MWNEVEESENSREGGTIEAQLAQGWGRERRVEWLMQGGVQETRRVIFKSITKALVVREKEMGGWRREKTRNVKGKRVDMTRLRRLVKEDVERCEAERKRQVERIEEEMDREVVDMAKLRLV